MESKFVRFADKVTRTFKLVSHSLESREFYGLKKDVDVIVCIDQVSGEEKEISANKNFMKELVKLDQALNPGDVIVVTPTARSFTAKNGEIMNTFDFAISKFVGDVQPSAMPNF